MEIVNVFTEESDAFEAHGDFSVRGTSIGPRLGAELIGGSVYDLEPGKKMWPYHAHHANEEWLLVLRGRPTLRTPDGERELSEGDTTCFPRGAAGAHQLWNATEETARVLMLSTLIRPEIVEYPDSGKVGTRDAKGDRLFIARPGPTLDYWDGE
jgi:uncharacterized cupin superfamily protein